MAWTTRGEKFLSDVNIDELKRSYDIEKKGKEKLRILACIKRKEGKTLDEIASDLNKPKMTISDWLRNIEKHGLIRLSDKKQTGKPSRLSKEQFSELKQIVALSPQEQGIPFCLWTTKLIVYLIETKYSVTYSLWQIRRNMQKLNFSLQKPRPEHHKANKKLQEEFKKKLPTRLHLILKQDGRSFVWMRV
jgi:transposase